MELKFSIVVPVYNRPEEIEELLSSLSNQTDRDFEVVVMEAVGGKSCEQVCRKYADKLEIKFVREDTDRSARRNHGMQLAKGNYFILFDSDCIIPKNYIFTLRRLLTEDYVDCYGGPDAAMADFSVVQRAVNYSMTSFFTTGGIRGAMKDVHKYLPRAFNMGFSRFVFEKIGGYRQMIGEDVDLSMRIKEAGFSVKLIKECYVYHKRRVTLLSFYRQVNTFGKARVLLSKLHPHGLKLTHLLPTFFVLGNLLLLGLTFYRWYFILPLLLYILLLFLHSFVLNRDIRVALLSPITAYLQLFGYGVGFIQEFVTGKASKSAAETLYRQ